jgi:hypothetical protein
VLRSNGQLLQAALALSKADRASGAAIELEAEAVQLQLAAAQISAQIDSTVGKYDSPAQEVEITECIINQVVHGHKTQALINVWNQQLTNALCLQSSLCYDKTSQDSLVAELSATLRHHEKAAMHLQRSGNQIGYSQSVARAHAARKQLLAAQSAAGFSVKALQVCEAFVHRTQTYLEAAQAQAERLQLLQQHMAAEYTLLEAKEAANGRLQMLRCELTSKKIKSKDACVDRDKENSSLPEQLNVSEDVQVLKAGGKHMEGAAVLRRSMYALQIEPDDEEVKELGALEALEAQAEKDLAILEGEVTQASKMRHYMQTALWYASCSAIASSKSSAAQAELDKVSFLNTQR